jgi:prepilin-type N-terminal cleavage/methylation domain-containing protein
VACYRKHPSGGQAGYTLIEVIVAGTLLSILVVGLSIASTATATMIADYQARAGAVVNRNVLRARMIADAAAASQVFCSGSKVVFRKTGGGPTVLTEYSIVGGRVQRWQAPPDKPLG